MCGEEVRDFVLAHDESKLGTRGRDHKNGTTLGRQLKALHKKNDFGPQMKETTLGRELKALNGKQMTLGHDLCALNGKNDFGHK